MVEIGACPRSQLDPAAISPEKRESCVNVLLGQDTSEYSDSDRKAGLAKEIDEVIAWNMKGL